MSTHTHATELPIIADPSSPQYARAHFDGGGRPSRLGSYVVVSLLAIGAGVGGTLFYQNNLQPRSPTPQTEQEGMMASEKTELSTPAAPAGAVFISSARQQLIGVRTTDATHQTLERRVRTVGTLAIDETRQAQVHTKIAGWTERVAIDFVGKPVRRGEVLFSIYSPQLVATQKEYLLALRAQREFAASEFEETRASADRLVAATRERLRLWDVTEAQIAALEGTGEVQRTLTIASPVSGVVTERNIYPGQYVTPELMAFKIADLSGVWAIGEVFEYELPFIKLGQRVHVEFPYGQASTSLTGKVAFIYPDVDPQTRRGRIRVDFPNPGLTFKPGTFVTLNIDTPAEMALVVPREAVIDTGSKQYVILAKEGGFFEPREVTVGTPGGDVYPVTSGLSHGDKVVTSAQFLIDSETNLQASMKAMVGHGHDMSGMETPEQPAPAGKSHEDMNNMPGNDHAGSADRAGSGAALVAPAMDHFRHGQ
ncbi:MAG TPA: efflux RND transporter periplasmic adaptor subunit [Vicinamibacterales bacterium]|nr:efflux RND transporter periplasmic adaptor subunit [Vicinamibacterales bacterium]